MSDFNPYSAWFDIPTNQQPPDHYRLLGVEMLEPDLKVLTRAARKRLAILKTHADGPESSFVRQMKREVEIVYACLIDVDSRMAYDRSLGLHKSQASDRNASQSGKTSAARDSRAKLPPLPDDSDAESESPPRANAESADEASRKTLRAVAIAVFCGTMIGVIVSVAARFIGGNSSSAVNDSG